VTDEGGHTTQLGYDALGRLTAVTDALGQVTEYRYDVLGRRASIVDARGHVTHFEYDALGRVVRRISPLGDSESSTHDASGRPLTTTDGRGQTIRYDYDVRGWLATLTLPDASVERFTYTDDGMVQTVTDWRGVTRYEYDPVTRRRARVTEPDGRYVRYEYDAMGNRTRTAHAIADGAPEDVARYEYDALNRLARVTDQDGGVTQYTYDAVGNRTGITRPNGTATELAHDARNRLTSVVHRNGAGVVLASVDYTLDAAGNRKVARHADGSRVEYEYDALYRVTAEESFDPAGASTGRTTYTYDSVGNVVQRTGALGNATFVYDQNDRLLAGAGVVYGYDGAGNRVLASAGPGAATGFEFDARGRLVGVQSATAGAIAYTYDFQDIRQSRTGPAGTVNFLVDRHNATGFAQVVRESDPLGTTLRRHLYGSDLLRSDDGTSVYRHADGLGSTRLLTDAAGAISDSYDYSAYGLVVRRTGSAANPYQFAGEQRDPESGLDYLRARYYDPATGRFLSRDPLPGEETIPLSLNKYLYVHGNPVNLVDPSGQITLMDLLTVFKSEINKYKQEIINLRRGLDRTQKTVGHVMRVVGGGLAMQAVADAATNKLRPVTWFGPVGAIPGVARLARTSWGMLTLSTEIATPLDTDPINNSVFVCADGLAVHGILPWAAIDREAIEARRTKTGSRNKVWVDLCPSFFTARALPSGTAGISLGPSQAGVMVHEFTHVVLGTKDVRYLYLCTPPLLSASSFGLAGGLFAASPLVNADNYRCLTEDAAIGGGAADRMRSFLKGL
jgi:RHS repeat-associated protein